MELLSSYESRRSSHIANIHSIDEIRELKSMILQLNLKVDSLIGMNRVVFTDGNKLLRKSPVQLHSSAEVIEYCKEMQQYSKETFRVLFLDEQNNLVGDEIIGIGTANHCFVQPQEIFRLAIKYAAAVIITVHNHPSGSGKPSKSDKELFAMIEVLSKTLEIPVLDNVIIGNDLCKTI